MSISLRWARGNFRTLIYAILLILLIIIRLLLETVTWQGTVQLHSVMEFIAATTSLFVGTLGLIRFYTRKETHFLFISAGFIGAGLLDAYHAVMAASFYDIYFPIQGSGNLPWSWNASPSFLSLLILGSWIVRGPSTGGQLERAFRKGTVRLLPLAFLSYALISFLGREYIASRPGQVAAAFATLFFFWALLGYFVEGRWKQERSEEWLVRGLIIIMVGQGLFMFFSQNLFDPLFTTAVVFKQLGYLCVLAGLLSSLYTVLKQAEQASAELSAANQTLQQEIAERKRAEQDIDRQRQLAEALREVGVALSAALEFDDLLNAFLDQVGRVLSYDQASVVMIAQQDNVLQSTRAPGQSRLKPESEIIQASLQYMQEIADSKLPLVIPNTETDPRKIYEATKIQIKSWAGAPVVLQDEVVALLTVSSNTPDMYQPNDAAVLIAFAGQAAIAIKNARLYSEVQQHVEQLKMLTNITQRITATLNVRETLNLVTEKTAQLLSADIVSVVLVDNSQEKPWLVVASGPIAAIRQDQQVAETHSLVGQVIASNASLLLIDMGHEDQWHTLPVNEDSYHPRSAICVPLRNRNQVVGAIEVLSRVPQAFDENDLQLLTLLARPAATAMENAQLYEEARREISDRKRAEAALAEERAHLAHHVEERTAELKVAVAELARASRLKDDFLASMSHELRTPLNTILGMVEALQEEVYGSLNEKQGSSLQAIGESGTHLLSLINDILDVSKIEGGKLELELLPVSVRSVCEASVRFVSREAHKKELDMQLDLEQAPDTITVDERRFKQILVNLLSNAVKFTPQGGRVGLRAKVDTTAKVVRFEVWDTGIGLAPEEVERLFQPFMQVDSRLSREYNGTGLGLALVHRLTKLHEGTVVVDSEVGSGSCFTINLPWQVMTEPLDVGQSQKAATPPTVMQTSADPNAARILLVEDNEVVITSVSDYLTVMGYEVLVARNGLEAVAMTSQHIPDVILMDVAMPKMDGLEAMGLIRSDEQFRQTPIIALTALAMAGDKERCLAAGATDYLSKPVRLKLLVEMIQRYTAPVMNIVQQGS